MKYKVITIIIVLVFSSCSNIVKKETNLYDLIPEDSKIVLSIKNLSKFKSSVTNNDYLNTITNSNLTIKNLISQLGKISDEKEVLVSIYNNEENLYYNIIGKEIHNDSISDVKYSFENINIVSNNPNYNPEISKKLFANKFKKINQTNTNFSIILDSTNTTNFLTKIFKEKINISSGNLILNIDSTNNLVFINGVVDDYSLNIDQTSNKIDIQEIINSDNDVYFDFDKDLITDYDLISTSQENKFDFFNLNNQTIIENKYKIFQLKTGDKIGNFNGVISDFKEKSKTSEIELKFKTSIANEIILGPLIVKNHTNNKNEVIVQDSKNIIYLINNNGQVEWTKKIDDKIIKEIKQIDSYKNGRLQYVFATKKSLYLVDRKGRDVGRFPLKFNDEITKPVSVFDYDKNKNYRLLITQGSELFMFDSKGSRVRGFDYDKKNRIVTKPKHFRISNKDIIVFKTSDNLTILNRRGKIRIKMKKNYDYSNDEIFQFQNSLVTNTSKNDIVKIDMSGNSKIDATMSFNSKIISNEKSMFTLQKNILSNSKNSIEIQFGKYEDFNIYNGKKNSFVNIFDSQNNKVYLFDSQLKLIKGFPISSDKNGSFVINNDRIEFSLAENGNMIKYYVVK